MESITFVCWRIPDTYAGALQKTGVGQVHRLKRKHYSHNSTSPEQNANW